MATIRVFKVLSTPEAEAIVATLRVALGEAEEELPAPREVLLHAQVPDLRLLLGRLVSLLDRYHPYWRRLITLSAERSPR